MKMLFMISIGGLLFVGTARHVRIGMSSYTSGVDRMSCALLVISLLSVSPEAATHQ